MAKKKKQQDTYSMPVYHQRLIDQLSEMEMKSKSAIVREMIEERATRAGLIAAPLSHRAVITTEPAR